MSRNQCLEQAKLAFTVLISPQRILYIHTCMYLSVYRFVMGWNVSPKISYVEVLTPNAQHVTLFANRIVADVTS